MQDNSRHDRRTHVRLGKETVTDGSASDFPGAWPNEDGTFRQDAFREALRVKTSKLTSLQAEVDIVGVDASIANAIRRILIAEVPTVAVENVYIWNNTSLIQDEVLSQRLGLIPLQIDATKLEFKTATDEPTDLNTVVFSLVIKCERHRNVPRDEIDPDKLYKNAHVYSSEFIWQPKGVQSELFASSPPRPVLNDILIAKLRTNQEIILEMHCEKGIGKDHAKWSPVATASYRLLPTITLRRPIQSDLCGAFAACFPPGVIEVRPDDKGRLQAIVADTRKDTVSREVLRHPEFADDVVLGRKRDHFIFTIESVGQYRAVDLLPGALGVFVDKIRTLRGALSAL